MIYAAICRGELVPNFIRDGTSNTIITGEQNETITLSQRPLDKLFIRIRLVLARCSAQQS